MWYACDVFTTSDLTPLAPLGEHVILMWCACDTHVVYVLQESQKQDIYNGTPDPRSHMLYFSFRQECLGKSDGIMSTYM